MFKIAKSKVVKIVEQKLRSGDREGAMKLLRQAEDADRTGAFTAKEIKGLHDTDEGEVGAGAWGQVRDRFYDGKMLPTKEMRTRGRRMRVYENSTRFKRMDEVLDFNKEGLTSRRIAGSIWENPDMVRSNVRTPEYFGDNAYGMVGQTAKGLQDELAKLQQSGPANKMSRATRGRIAEINRRFEGMKWRPKEKDDGQDIEQVPSAYRIDAHQVQPMSRLPAHSVNWEDLSKDEQDDIQSRYNQWREHQNTHGFIDADKELRWQQNVRIGPTHAARWPSKQRPLYMYDFGKARFYAPDPTTQELNAEKDRVNAARHALWEEQERKLIESGRLVVRAHVKDR
ncbi:MAG: hypothetical protein ACO32I_06205 [Candidatus Limnocylindrus sp.]